MSMLTMIVGIMSCVTIVAVGVVTIAYLLKLIKHERKCIDQAELDKQLRQELVTFTRNMTQKKLEMIDNAKS